MAAVVTCPRTPAFLGLAWSYAQRGSWPCCPLHAGWTLSMGCMKASPSLGRREAKRGQRSGALPQKTLMAHCRQDSDVPVLQPCPREHPSQPDSQSTVCWRGWFCSENFPLKFFKSSQEDGKIFSQKHIRFSLRERGRRRSSQKRGEQTEQYLPGK